MKLYYETYRRLMAAIKKHCLLKGIRQYNNRALRQSVIYKHFIGKFGSFIAVNSLGNKQFFWKRGTKSENRSSRKEFSSFMEESANNKNRQNHVDRSKDESLPGHGQQAKEDNGDIPR